MNVEYAGEKFKLCYFSLLLSFSLHVEQSYTIIFVNEMKW
uniref:Uncharacterized protein n=1 Tax=Rhizophora mucronata TaxID=61149 RepID=A0A2P2Q5Y2_RHIMU